jgi:hypothetical protein
MLNEDWFALQFTAASQSQGDVAMDGGDGEWEPEG